MMFTLQCGQPGISGEMLSGTEPLRTSDDMIYGLQGLVFIVVVGPGCFKKINYRLQVSQKSDGFSSSKPEPVSEWAEVDFSAELGVGAGVGEILLISSQASQTLSCR